jgi:hypothetical protein
MENLRNRHVQLIEFLKQFDLYNNAKIVYKERCTHDLKNVDVNDINMAVFLVCDFLNQPTGSSGDFNLYKLLQSYLKDKEKRQEINHILDL